MVPTGWMRVRARSNREAHGERRQAVVRSEVGTDQMIRASASACVDLGRGGVDQVAIGVEGAEQAGLVELHPGVNAFQSVLPHEKHLLSCPQNCTARRAAS